MYTAFHNEFRDTLEKRKREDDNTSKPTFKRNMDIS